jgi:protein involved in polysaccharide export with SLBB domain
MKKIIVFSTFFFSFLYIQNSFAQDILKSSDLKTVKVDSLSDEEIQKIKAQLVANNATIEKLQPVLLSKGMSYSEFSKLKSRLESSKSISKDKFEEDEEDEDSTDRMAIENKGKNKKDRTEEEEDVYRDEKSSKTKKNYQKPKDTLSALIFGSDLFTKPTLNFQPNLKLATPVNYILGPSDELQVSVYGVQEYNANIRVSVDGTVNIQYVGQIAVTGMTIEAATQKIRSAIARVYSTVGSGQSQVSVTLGKIRTIKITIIGGKQPGNYSVSSLSTVFNALFLAGGPGNNGSYRNIELLRNYKVIRKIDIYNFLMNGDQSDNIGLKDNDVIKIPTYKNRVIVNGEVKRPGIFELKAGEKFSDLMTFASGFTDLAYTGSIGVIQKTGKEYRVKDIKEGDFKTYVPQTGDVFKISKILNRFENRIKIKGAVYRPDFYSYTKGMKVSELIAKADGLKDEAYMERAIIMRKKDDLTTEVINIELAELLKGNKKLDIELKREDEVTIYSKYDFKEQYKITIDGEIKKPGDYPFFENITLNDLILEAGGLSGAASKRVEIARLIISDEIGTNTKQSELFNIEITPENNEQIERFELKPFDVVNIRKIVSFDKQQIVTVSGAFNYPGKYVLTKKNEKIFDVIKRAGGLSIMGDNKSVKIKRPIKIKQIEELNAVNSSFEKTTAKNEEGTGNKKDKLVKKLTQELKYAIIPVEYDKISKNQKSYNNISLQDGDEIEVTTISQSVKVSGNVLLTSEIPFVNKGLNYYINAVGGIDGKGWKKRAYVIYPNGKAAVTSNFLFFRSYPKITPGSQIVIPEKPERVKASTGEIIGISSAVASLAGVVIAIFNLSK